MQLQKAVEIFLKEDRALETNKTYTSLLSQVMQFLGPRRQLQKLTILDLKAWHQDLLEQNYKPGTITMFVKVTKIFFNWCLKNDMIAASPARTLIAGTNSRRNAETKAATPQEVERFLNWAQFDPLLYAIVLFLVQSGARAGEAASLRIQDLDFENRTAMVVMKGGKARWGRPEERREVVLGDAAAAAIRAWLQRRDRNGVVNEQVFALNERPITGRRISTYIRRRTPKVLDRRVTAHQFRHYFGEMLALEGVAISLIARLMGHKNEMVTLSVYAPRDTRNAKAAAYPLIDSKLPAAHRVDSDLQHEEESAKIIRFPFKALG